MATPPEQVTSSELRPPAEPPNPWLLRAPYICSLLSKYLQSVDKNSSASLRAFFVRLVVGKHFCVIYLIETESFCYLSFKPQRCIIICFQHLDDSCSWFFQTSLWCLMIFICSGFSFLLSVVCVIFRIVLELILCSEKGIPPLSVLKVAVIITRCRVYL